jgi:hypothetical protein
MKLARTTYTIACALIIGAWTQGALAANRIQDLDWMTGHWTGTYNGLPMEAHYSNSAGGMILGMTKIANGEKSEFFEFEQVAQEGDSLILRPMPFAKKGVEFPLKELNGTRAVFENPTHEFPTRIIYELKATGELLARIEGMQNGQPAEDSFVFTKAK